MWIALALAIALHEIVLVAFPHSGRTDDAEKVQVAQLVRISVVHRATPTPQPTPRPTPKPIIVIAPVNPLVLQKSTPAPAAPVAKAGLARSIARTKYHSTRIVQHVAIVPKHATGPGLGLSGTGRGQTGTQGAGTGTGGQGTGSGSGGNGSGAGGGNEPCGPVYFININGAGYDRSTGGFHRDILLRVFFRGGAVQEARLDWQWYFPSEASDPWSDQNVKNQDFPITFQFPPADKRASEPDVVQYVIAHTTPDGFTTLPDCR